MLTFLLCDSSGFAKTISSNLTLGGECSLSWVGSAIF
jgi:hypothetical protein